MRIARWLAIAVGVYIVLVVAFECFVTYVGKRQADHGVGPDEDWVVITTTDAAGPHDTVIAGVEVDGHLYVSANHWPRSWYRRATAHPEVEVTHAGHRGPFKAVPVSGEELVRVAARYHLPWMVRFLSGFPPRSYLRLDTR